jgi:hypothetical protein
MSAGVHIASALRAPRIYLDLRDVIEVCRVRRGVSRTSEARRSEYQTISNAVINGICTVLFNPAVCAEFDATPPGVEPWEDIVEFFTTAPSVLEVDSLYAYTIELVDEVRRLLPGIPLPSAPVLRAPGEWNEATMELLRHHPDWKNRGELIPASRPKNLAVRDWMDSMRRMAHREPATLRARIEGWRESVAQTRRYFHSVAKDAIAPDALVHWMRHANRLDAIITSAAPEVDASQLLRRVDIRRCPAANAFVRAFWVYVYELGDRLPGDNDSDDWVQVPAIVHADFALVEKRMRHYLTAGCTELAARVFTKPADLVRALELPARVGGASF